MSELVHLYDVVKEDSTLESKTADEDKRKGSKSDSSKEVSGRRSRGEEGMEGVGRRGAEKTEGAVKTEGAITCNSAEMVREKQPISRSSNGETKLVVCLVRNPPNSKDFVAVFNNICAPYAH